MEIIERMFPYLQIEHEHVDLIRQNFLSHTTFAYHDDANAKVAEPEVTVVVFLVHSEDPGGGSRTGIKVAGFPQFDISPNHTRSLQSRAS